MPFSNTSQISTIIQYIERIKPTSLLDVGVGMGQYGFLARTHIEHINLFEVSGSHAKQRPKEEWQVRIDGIEGFDVYITPVHDYSYNNMMIGNALEILPTLPENSYELVLAIDILEHFTKTDGLRFLSQIKRVASKAALISTPKKFIPQEVEANPYENHRSLWGWEEFIENGFEVRLANGFSWIGVSDLS